MKATEILNTPEGQTLSDLNFLRLVKKGQHCELVFAIGCGIPTTKRQLSRFTHLDVLLKKDIELINGIFPEADFKFTKSKTFARLTNFDDFKLAVAKTLK